MVTVSRDRGRTWSDPVTATPDDDVIYFQPNLAVDETGLVAISAFALANNSRTKSCSSQEPEGSGSGRRCG